MLVMGKIFSIYTCPNEIKILSMYESSAARMSESSRSVDLIGKIFSEMEKPPEVKGASFPHAIFLSVRRSNP